VWVAARHAGTLADRLAVMQTELRRIEVARRRVAIQARFLAVAWRGGAGDRRAPGFGLNAVSGERI